MLWLLIHDSNKKNGNIWIFKEFLKICRILTITHIITFIYQEVEVLWLPSIYFWVWCDKLNKNSALKDRTFSEDIYVIRYHREVVLGNPVTPLSSNCQTKLWLPFQKCSLSFTQCNVYSDLHYFTESYTVWIDIFSPLFPPHMTFLMNFWSETLHWSSIISLLIQMI